MAESRVQVWLGEGGSDALPPLLRELGLPTRPLPDDARALRDVVSASGASAVVVVAAVPIDCSGPDNGADGLARVCAVRDALAGLAEGEACKSAVVVVVFPAKDAHPISPAVHEACLGNGVHVVAKSADALVRTLVHVTALPAGPVAGGEGRGADVDAFEGCVVGVAVGDAVGAPVEGRPDAAAFATALRSSLRNTRNVRHRDVGYAFGQVTDDTQNTRALLAALVESAQAALLPPGGHAPPALRASAFVDWLAWLVAQRRMVGMGSTSKAALRNVTHKHMGWTDASGEVKGVSNGSCMRASPVGLASHADASGMSTRRLAVLQSHVTHASAESKTASAAVGAAVAAALRLRFAHRQHSTADVRAAVLSHVRAVTQGMDGNGVDYAHVLAEMLNSNSNSNSNAPAEAVVAVMKGLVPLPSEEDGFRSSTRGWSISVYAPHTALWAIYCFLRSPGDFWECVLSCVAGGGDTDTTAAIAGSISGAYNGLSRICHPAKGALRPHHQGHEDWADVVAGLLGAIRDTPWGTLGNAQLFPPALLDWDVAQLRRLAQVFCFAVEGGSLPNRVPRWRAPPIVQGGRGGGGGVVVVVGVCGDWASPLERVAGLLLGAAESAKTPTAHVREGDYSLGRVFGSAGIGRGVNWGALVADVALERAELAPGSVVLVHGQWLFECDLLARQMDWVVWVGVSEHTARKHQEHHQAGAAPAFAEAWPRAQAHRASAEAGFGEKLVVVDGDGDDDDALAQQCSTALGLVVRGGSAKRKRDADD